MIELDASDVIDMQPDFMEAAFVGWTTPLSAFIHSIA